MPTLKPSEINFHKLSRTLELSFNDGSSFNLPAEYLRVFSPSAEVQGHGPGQETLQVGKEDVNITSIEAVGHYALSLAFDDNHNTGIYSWEYLHQLGQNYADKWQAYLEQLTEAGYERKAD
ncbi:MAG: DUF971 domain-containing protein [Gammaproteobacteria bacterium]|nr:DUF971 domain-containing protein [Gammaproteobacteria bacterium]